MSFNGSGDEQEEVEVNLLDDQEDLFKDFFEDEATASSANRPPEENNPLDEGMDCCPGEDATEEDVEESPDDPSTNNEGVLCTPQFSQEVDSMEGQQGSGSAMGVNENHDNSAIQGEGDEAEVEGREVSNVVHIVAAGFMPLMRMPFLVNIGSACASDKGQNTTSNRGDHDGQLFPEGIGKRTNMINLNIPSVPFLRSKEPQPSTSKNFWRKTTAAEMMEPNTSQPLERSAPEGTEKNEGNLISSLPDTGEKYDEYSDHSSVEETQEGDGGSTTRQLQRGPGTGLAATQPKKKARDVKWNEQIAKGARTSRLPSMDDCSEKMTTFKEVEEASKSAPPQKAKTSSKSKERTVGPARKKPKKGHPKRVGWFGGDVFTVEEVIDSRIKHDEDGNSFNEYCIKWLGYGNDHNTWDRESETFEEKIEDYWMKTVKKINRHNSPMLKVPVAEEPTSCYFID